MTSFPKTAEILDKATNPYFKNPRAPSVAKNQSYFVMVKHNFTIFFSIPMLTETYKIPRSMRGKY